MDIAAFIIIFLFLCFCVVLVALELKGMREDVEEDKREILAQIQQMPRDEADEWLQNPDLPGPWCSCGTYNLAYATRVKTNGGDHEALRCQPERERIDN